MAYETTTVTTGGVTLTYSTDGVNRGIRGERWYRCSICSLNFQEHDVRKFRGKIYGIPCGDAADIPDIVRRQNAHGRTDK